MSLDSVAVNTLSSTPTVMRSVSRGSSTGCGRPEGASDASAVIPTRFQTPHWMAVVCFPFLVLVRAIAFRNALAAT